VPDPWRSIKLRDFEYVVVSPTTMLLRLGGRGPRWGAGGSRPTLVATSRDAINRFNAIPSPPDTRGLLRAAYSVPPELVSPTTKFSLHFDDGHVIVLPEPTEGVARPTTRGAAVPGAPVPVPPVVDPSDVGPPGTVPPGAEAQAVAAVPAAVESIEQPQADERLAAAEARFAELEAEARRAVAQVQELETWRGELERSLTAATDELSEVRAARRADAARMQQLQDELAAATATNERLRAEAEEARAFTAPDSAHEDELSAARAKIEGLRLELAAARETAADAKLDAIRHAAETEAREQAERELDKTSPAPD